MPKFTLKGWNFFSLQKHTSRGICLLLIPFSISNNNLHPSDIWHRESKKEGKKKKKLNLCLTSYTDNSIYVCIIFEK